MCGNAHVNGLFIMAGKKPTALKWNASFHRNSNHVKHSIKNDKCLKYFCSRLFYDLTDILNIELIIKIDNFLELLVLSTVLFYRD